MEVRFITALNNFNVEGLSQDWQLGEYFLAKSIGPSPIFTEELIKVAGSIIIQPFARYPYFYRVEDIDDKEKVPAILTSAHSILNLYSGFLWFAKDSSVSVSCSLSYIPSDKHSILYRAALAAASNSIGEFSAVTFNEDDLKLAYSVHEKIAKIQSKFKGTARPEWKGEAGIMSDTGFHYRDYNTINRIERAASFLNMARNNSFLPLKISLYIAVLECLFTTDHGEITHKVSERTAFYIGGTFEEKLANYRIMKKSYDIRSKFFHGQILEKGTDTRPKLQERAKDLDTLLRKVLIKVVLSDSEIFLNEGALTDYFNSLVFGEI